MQNVCGGSYSFIVPWDSNEAGVFALWMFTQYEVDFMHESPWNIFDLIHIYLPHGRNFLQERVKMHICIPRGISTFCIISMDIRMMAD